MPQFVSAGAEAVRDSPQRGATVTLVVRVDEESLTDMEEWVTAHRGEVLDSLDHGLLEITLLETAVGELCDCEDVISVETADEMIGVLDQGN